MMDTLALEQRSDEWIKARIGSLGASCVHEVVAKTKTGYSTSRANRLAALVCERLTGLAQDTYQNAAMLHGIETEPEARAAYAFYSGAEAVEVGLVRHPTIAGTHASPDGLIGDDGLLEIKAPNTATHIATLLGGTVDGRYITQMQWQLACTGRKWCDFVSFDPRMPENMRFFVKRIQRDDAHIATLEAEVQDFLKELDATVARLLKTYGGAVAVAA